MSSDYYTTKACKLPDYLELVDFYRKPDYEQIKYLLFFVTEVAGLRKDMTARVIKQRLYNQGLHIEQEKVDSILEERQRYFTKSPHPYNPNTDNDRNPNEIAYIINPEERDRLVKQANIKWQTFKWWMRPDSKFLAVAAICLIIILGYFYVSEYISGNVDDISWKEYRHELKMDSIPETERAKYMLYFITEHIKFRDDMTPSVISDRLNETDLGKIDADSIEKYFLSKPNEVSPSNTRAGAYKITAREANNINERLGLKTSGQFNVAWLIQHWPLDQLGAFGSLLLFLFYLVFWFGRHTAHRHES